MIETPPPPSLKPTDDVKRDSIARKIAKLMKLSESPNANEAASAAAKAQELLFAYKLSMSDIKTDTLNEADPMSEIGYELGKRVDVWKHRLAGAVARAYCCRTIHWTTRRYQTAHKIAFLGRKNDTEVAWFVFGYIAEKIDGMIDREFLREYSRLVIHGEPALALAMNKRSWGNDFGTGAVETIRVRLRENRKQFEGKHEECRALMVRSDAEVESFFDKMHPKTKSMRAGRGVKHYSAHMLGAEAAKNINLDQKALSTTAAAEKAPKKLGRDTGGTAEYVAEFVTPRFRNLES